MRISDWSSDVCSSDLGYEADNTRGNAVETAAWMKDQDFTSLRLVTATYHMPRSLLEFRRLMPDIEIVPHPVFTEHFKRDDWWMWPGSSSLLITEYTKYLVALLRGPIDPLIRSEEHTSELQSLMRISYAVFCLKKKKSIIHLF